MLAISCTKENPRREITRTGTIAYRAKLENGEGGIRTLDTGVNPYNGLANRRFRPLSHLSQIVFYVRKLPQHYYYNK